MSKELGEYGEMPWSCRCVVVCVMCALFGCNLPVDQEDDKKPNVLLIVVDTLRADHMSAYGYSRKTSPNFDALADSSALFLQNSTVINRTAPAAVSLATGLYPHTHGTRSNHVKSNMYASEGNLMLAEILKDAGLQTVAYVNQNLLAKKFGMGQGFDLYLNLDSDERVSEMAVDWLANKRDERRPFFMQLWYFSPHWPYVPSTEDLQRFTNSHNHDSRALAEKGMSVNSRAFSDLFDKQEREFLISSYDAEIYGVDHMVGQVIESLRAQNLFENTIVVITSDHGESLEGHGIHFEHGEFFYDETALVPLLIKRPHQTQAEIVDHPSRLIDIFPTVLSLVGLPYISVEGKNLFPTDPSEREHLEQLIAFGENGYRVWSNNRRRYVEGIAGKWRIARTSTSKLIYIPHPEQDIFEFYDIATDPNEQNNLVDDPICSAEIQILKAALFEWIKPEDFADIDPITEEQIPPDVRQRLKSLGYL